MSTSRLRRVLVANRGEIARRIVRGCHAENLEAVAVFSDADAGSPVLREADAAVRVGPGPAAESYLNAAALLRAAEQSAADAVHPGYGFLSENAAFAAAVGAAGLAWVGPPPSAIAAMGDKVAARATVAATGVPVVPGTDTPLGDGEDPVAAAQGVGYPLMVKAAAGGGGIGMTRVDAEADLAGAVATARQRAGAAFGDSRVYLERYLDRPRHVEIQVLADSDGGTIHLGERECSVQRRHQKVIEESPSCAVDEALRSRMGEAAITAARAIGYVNAGTVEFLVDASRSFHFLEMNTRLQVEHPVTEMRTGLDLVRLQLRIAAGSALPVAQSDVTSTGHAIEMRVYAEDPIRFLPSPGAVTEYVEPRGEGVRVDSAVEAGTYVSHLYDPLLAKLIVHDSSRAAAIGSALRALDGFRIAGVKTNLPLHAHVLRSAPFRSGDYDTSVVAAIGPVPRPSVAAAP